jgi:transcription elongation factor Elf1
MIINPVGVIVDTDKTDHITFYCSRCNKKMEVIKLNDNELPVDGKVTYITLKCNNCNREGTRKFCWNNKKINK